MILSNILNNDIETPTENLIGPAFFESDSWTTPTDFNQNFLLGTQSVVGPKWNAYRVYPYAQHEYTETGFDMLSEFRDATRAIGINQFKFKLSPKTCEGYKLSCESTVNSLTELAKEPSVAATFDDPNLTWYHMWVYSYSNPDRLRRDWTEVTLQAEYNETYEWAVHMLTTYENTNKAFFVGNWEGDWELLSASRCVTEEGTFDLDCAPTPEVIQRYIKWAKTRQDAINAAKRDTAAKNVHMFYYIEFNLGLENNDAHPYFPEMMRPTIVNSVAMDVNPDFLSYSSYKSTNAYTRFPNPQFNQTLVESDFWNVLDYAESALADKPDTDFSLFGTTQMTKRVFVGEFSPILRQDPARHAPATARIVKSAIEWGCPFVLHWALYDNESNTVALVPRDATRIDAPSSLHNLFQDWAEASDRYVAIQRPTLEEFRDFAVKFFGQRTEIDS